MSLLDRYSCSRSRLVVWSVRVFALAMVWLALLAARPALAQETWFVDAGINDGLVAHWRFDENFGTSVRDFVGTAHGTVMPSAPTGTYTTTVPNVGLPNNAAIDINTTRHISITTNPAPPTDQFSIAAWVRRDSAGTFHHIYDSGNQANHWRFFISGGNCNGSGSAQNRLALGLFGIGDVCASSEFPTDGAYHHVAAVKLSSGIINLYMDGALVGTGGSPGTFNTPSGTAIIGALRNGTTIQLRFNGVLDDVRIYRRALDAAEVVRLATGHGCVTDGTDWGKAFRDLQCALKEAAPGDDVVIAKGLYYPGTNLRSNFNVENNLHLYGGYENGDPVLPRPFMNLGAFPEEMTILSGDIDRNDGLENPAFATYGGNTRRVVHLSQGNTTHLQGLQVRGGNANEPGTSPSQVAFAQGAGMHAFLGSSATLVNVSLFKNQSRLDGAGVYAEGNLSVTDSGFTRNQSPVDPGGGGGGGAIYVKGSLAVTGSAFSDNFSDMPGGAISAQGPATITGSQFGNNSVDTFYGGAIATLSALTVTDSSFVGGFAPFGGGAIALQFGAISGLIENTTFESNSGSSGGAIDSSATPLIVRNSTFLNNIARARGGAISISAVPTTTLLIEDSTFTGNQVHGLNCIDFQHICSNGEGGAIGSSASNIIRRSTFTMNFAVRDGGAIHLSSGSGARSTLIEDSDFTANATSNNSVTGVVNSGSGGAIFANSPMVVRDSTFAGNFSSIEGGAIRSFRLDSEDDNADEERVWLEVAASKFISNSSVSGGAILLIGNGEIADTLFRENDVRGTASGAAIVIYPEFITSTLALTVTDSEFALHEQGAIYVGGESNSTLPALIANNLFRDNFSPDEQQASDIFDDGPQTQVLHNTFVRSDPSDFASIVSTSNTLIRNNIFYFDPAITPVRPAIRDSDGTNAIESHNLFFNANIRDIFAGTITSQGGTVTSDPLFVDQAGGNFHLRALSPARNAGTTTAVTSDFEGDVRPIGSAPDIGYDEARFVAPLITPPGSAFALINQPVTFALGLFVDSDNDGSWQVTINWGDGSADTVFNQGATGTISPQSHTYAAADVYDVTITVRDAAGLTHVATFQVTAAPPPTETPTATPPGNPATPTPPPNVQFLPAISKP